MADFKKYPLPFGDSLQQDINYKIGCSEPTAMIAPMKIVRTVFEMRAYRASVPASLSVGLVATMGALHSGHRSLVERSVSENDITIVSIFVNPAQFARGEDLESYPRTEEEDLKVCESENTTVVFLPDRDEVYPGNFETWVTTDVGQAQRNEKSEGCFRPTFFKGVATVLTKLFVLMKPTKVYFGQKDAQQCAVVKRLVLDLWLECELMICDTVREHDGLAMSSRNVYLGVEERVIAGRLWRGLNLGLEMVKQGERDASLITEGVWKEIERDGKGVRMLYVAVCDRWSMREVVGSIVGECLICVAAMVGRARLIDNVIVKMEEEDGGGGWNRKGAD